MCENAISLEHKEAIAEFLFSIPRISHLQFSKHLALLHLSLNQKEMKPDAFFTQDEQHTLEREEQHQQQITGCEDISDIHNSYYYEQDLYQHIKDGNIQNLEGFLASCPPPKPVFWGLFLGALT